MKEEVIGGLKNALERGASLEVAIQSFINAGYNASEVQEAAAEISSGASNILHQASNTQSAKIQQSPQMQTSQSLQQIQQNSQTNLDAYNQPKNKSSGRTALLIVLILFLLLILGSIVLVLIYKDNVADFVNKLIGA